MNTALTSDRLFAFLQFWGGGGGRMGTLIRGLALVNILGHQGGRLLKELAYSMLCAYSSEYGQ